MPARAWLFGLAAGSAALCAATGLSYPGFVADEGASAIAPLFVILGLLGASVLFAVGLLQWRAAPRSRFVVLVLLAAASGAYVASNGFGLAVTGPDAPGFLRALHWAGVAVGGTLYVWSLVDAAVEFRRRPES